MQTSGIQREKRQSPKQVQNKTQEAENELNGNSKTAGEHTKRSDKGQEQTLHINSSPDELQVSEGLAHQLINVAPATSAANM